MHALIKHQPLCDSGIPQYLLPSPLINALCTCVVPPDHCWMQVELCPVALWQLADEGPLRSIIPAEHYMCQGELSSRTHKVWKHILKRVCSHIKTSANGPFQ